MSCKIVAAENYLKQFGLTTKYSNFTRQSNANVTKECGKIEWWDIINIIPFTVHSSPAIFQGCKFYHYE